MTSTHWRGIEFTETGDIGKWSVSVTEATVAPSVSIFWSFGATAVKSLNRSIEEKPRNFFGYSMVGISVGGWAILQKNV